jgi:hypothetical protein
LIVLAADRLRRRPAAEVVALEEVGERMLRRAG